ncbi:transketolase [Amylibacter sp.]|jgi:prefoldin subunit 5|nr:transketolase [Rhodobacterales bacterium]MDA7739714.1 transketolase [Amylibacter sp.]MDA7759601.1 transketolase [Amylibacter sp.]MDB4078808.1 transketolase [Amylibacter sp.]MDB4130298.1 transketolase [Amylibacter sp.]|tara:strand:+ start:115 stop:447 length:333 start_codon:yes stop_codon:yes gene_type:complete
MTQIPVLKKDFEIAISSIQNRIEDLSKNKFENENLISELKDENNILKSQIEELQQSLIKDKEPEFGFTDTSNIESLSLSDNNYEELKSQHQRDINEVQNILDQLKDLVEE